MYDCITSRNLIMKMSSSPACPLQVPASQPSLCGAVYPYLSGDTQLVTYLVPQAGCGDQGDRINTILVDLVMQQIIFCCCSNSNSEEKHGDII